MRDCRTQQMLLVSGRLGLCFAGLWLFVALVSVHDACLVVLNRDVIVEVEQNPLGRYLLELNRGDVWLLLVVKALGTWGACSTMLVMYHWRRSWALAVAIGVAVGQLILLAYLTFAPAADRFLVTD